jgi:hypothetical protein
MNNSNQKLKFNNSGISQSGFANQGDLNRDVQEQMKFVNNYSSFTPNNTFANRVGNNPHMPQSDYSQFNVNSAFQVNTPIMTLPPDKNTHDTLYDNLNENLKKEAITEIRLNIDSLDRDTKIYPDPFKYTVTFGPVVNSGVDTTILRSELKNDLRQELKKMNKQRNPLDKKKASQEDFSDDLLIYSTNPNIIVNYDDKLKRVYNPYIVRDFRNVKFIRLDSVVLPRFNKVIINSAWNYCNICQDDILPCTCYVPKTYIKDDYERIRTQIILNDRYIPDDNHIGPLFTDRYVLINIKEISNNNNLATNHINTQSFTIFPDKFMGVLYFRGNPYYAVKIYKDSELGNINRLSFEFFDSWGAPIILNRLCVNYETNQIISTDVINPAYVNIQDVISDPKLNVFFINKMNEIVKCYVMVNYNIKCKIPFYFDKETIKLIDKQKNCSLPEEKCEDPANPCAPRVACEEPCGINKCKTFQNLSYPIFNKTLFEFTNIYTELNEFVSLQGFINVNKLTTTGKTVSVTINEYINNVFWYNYDKKFINEVIHNITALFNNYISFGYKVLDRLKMDALGIPLNKYFQNHLMFIVGTYQIELSTKVNYESR